MPYRLAIPHQHETGKKENGEPTGIRTPDTRLRRPLLYPTELWTHICPTCLYKKLERMMRIELTLSAWKAEVLPLNYIRKIWSGRRDSNSRPSPWQGDALPLSHFRMYMVEGDGFEPSKAVLTDLQSAPFGRSGTPRQNIGADGGNRTPNLLITNQLLYR